MTRKQRDYKAEYQRRIKRGKERGYSVSVARGHPKRARIKMGKLIPAEEPARVRRIHDMIDADKRRVFGRKIPLRQKGETPEQFGERLAEEQKRAEGRLKWTNQEDFIAMVEAMGLTENEAYTHWFS